MKTSTFVENMMILCTTVNLVKLMESNIGYENDLMSEQIMEFTLNELFRTVLILDDGIWN